MRWRYLTIFVLAVLALVGLRELVRATDLAQAGANAGAAWIWGKPRGEPGTPTAIFAATDFRLDFKPVRAEIEIAGDEDYHLLINGRGVAAGRYRGGLDSYPVGRILRHGNNRIVVELRSARGVGGLLVRLHIDGPEGQSATVVSDGSWRIMRRYVQGFSRPGSKKWGEPALVWGTPPTGRWQAIGQVRRALTLRRLQGGRAKFPLAARRCHRLGERWATMDTFGGAALGRWVTFDFGRERTGFLHLRFADDNASSGFVYYGIRKPKEGLEHPDEVVIRTPGRGHWSAAAPATFRYVTVVGAPQVRASEVTIVDAELAGDLVLRQAVEPLFGVERPLTLVSPVEHEVRSKLEGIPSLARREEG